MLDFSFVVFISPCPPYRAKGKKASERVTERWPFPFHIAGANVPANIHIRK